MPLKLNVGASRKVTDNNYGSRGASVNLEMEFDSALADDPPKLHEEIRRLFDLVRTSLRAELKRGYAPANGPADGPTRSNEISNGNGQDTPPEAGPRRSTQSQCKALYAIARTQRVDLTDYLRERYGVERPHNLTLRQASAAIDNLKGTAAAPRS